MKSPRATLQIQQNLAIIPQLYADTRDDAGLNELLRAKSIHWHLILRMKTWKLLNNSDMIRYSCRIQALSFSTVMIIVTGGASFISSSIVKALDDKASPIFWLSDNRKTAQVCKPG